MILADVIDPIAKAKTAIITGVACVAICLPLGYCTGYDAAKSKADAERAIANVAVTKQAVTVGDQIAAERAVDAIVLAQQTKDLTDAVVAQPDTLPDAARVALGCERLHQAGTDTTAIPACVRPEGSDGIEAAPIH